MDAYCLDIQFLVLFHIFCFFKPLLYAAFNYIDLLKWDSEVIVDFYFQLQVRNKLLWLSNYQLD